MVIPGKVSCWEVFRDVSQEGDILSGKAVSGGYGLFKAILLAQALESAHHIVEYQHLKFEI